MSERERLEAVIERDRHAVAVVLQNVRSALRSYRWLLEGRGPYEWDDERYRDEFERARAAVETAIEPLAKIARDLTDSPPTEAARARALRASSDADVFGYNRFAQGACQRCGYQPADCTCTVGPALAADAEPREGLVPGSPGEATSEEHATTLDGAAEASPSLSDTEQTEERWLEPLRELYSHAREAMGPEAAAKVYRRALEGFRRSSVQPTQEPK